MSRLIDGTTMIRGRLDATGGEKISAALESLLPASRPAGDRRSRAQQLADALVQLADNALPAGDLPVLRTVRPTVVVTIGPRDLHDPATGPGAATTGFGSPLSAARARAVACDATISTVLLDHDGLPLSVGRSRRVVPPHLRRAVELRDQGCVFAGCAAPTHWADVHHLVHWAHGGQTSLDNSALREDTRCPARLTFCDSFRGDSVPRLSMVRNQVRQHARPVDEYRCAVGLGGGSSLGGDDLPPLCGLCGSGAGCPRAVVHAREGNPARLLGVREAVGARVRARALHRRPPTRRR